MRPVITGFRTIARRSGIFTAADIPAPGAAYPATLVAGVPLPRADRESKGT